MNDSRIFKSLINDNLREMSDIVDCLYTTSGTYAKNRLLNRLRKNMSNIATITQGFESGEIENVIEPGAERVFTLDELSKFNGKDGNPAYVAVNGIVYDVSNNAAWGGATHFGLVSGTDVTREFASCHAGQPILSKLAIVGKLA